MVAGSLAAAVAGGGAGGALPRPARSGRDGRHALYREPCVVRSARYPLCGGRGRHLGRHAAAVGRHRIYGYVRFVADANRMIKEYFLWFCLLERRRLRLLHLGRPLHDVHVLRGGADPDVPADRRLGQRPQGVCRHEADADAHGRFGAAADRHSRHLFRRRGD